MKNFLTNSLLLLLLSIASSMAFAVPPRILNADQIDGQKQNRNYLKTFDAEKNIKGWICTGGGSQSVTRTATTPLSGLGSFLFTLPAVNDACYFPFTIDNGDVATMLRTTFKYLPITSSGTYTDGEFEIDILDGSGAAIESKIQPSQIFGTSLAKDQQYMEFQTQPANLNYRFVVKRVVASSTSTLKMDKLFLGQAAKISGPVDVYLGQLTTTGSFVNNTTYTGKYWRRGEKLMADVFVNFTGTPEAAIAFTVNLPSGLTHSGQISGMINGRAYLGAATNWDGNVFTSGTNKIAVRSMLQSSTLYDDNPLTNSYPIAIVSGNYAKIVYEVPIAGWSSNQGLSEDVGSRLIVASLIGSTTTIANSQTITPIQFTSKVYDTAGKTTLNSNVPFVVPEAGYYKTTVGYGINSTNHPTTGWIDLFVLKNGIQSGMSLSNIRSATGIDWASASGTHTDKYNTGDTIGAGVSMAGGNATMLLASATLQIEKISSPHQVAASEKVFARYTASGLAIATSILKFPTKTQDTTNSYDTSTGFFTAPRSGVLTTCFGLRNNSAAITTSQYFGANTSVNGTRVALSSVVGTGNSMALVVGACSHDYIIKGQQAAVHGNSTAGTLDTDSTTNFISFLME